MLFLLLLFHLNNDYYPTQILLLLIDIIFFLSTNQSVIIFQEIERKKPSLEELYNSNKQMLDMITIVENIYKIINMLLERK